ncbi:MAG: FadR/GntR family transcriptional regulator [Chloroflexota bacterium]
MEPGQRTLRLPETNGRLYQTAQQAIKHYIVEHRLQANDPLPTEGQLAQELGISRTSAREAVKALESLGILETRPGVGLFLRPFSFDPILDNLAYSLLIDRNSVTELLHVRQQLEAGFVELVASAVTPDQLRVLRSVVDRMGARAARGEAFTEEDRFFHQVLYAGLDNRLLLKLLEVFWVVYRRLLDEAVVTVNDDPVGSWEDHRRIVEALEASDGRAARAAMLAHFANLERRLASPAAGHPGHRHDAGP